MHVIGYQWSWQFEYPQYAVSVRRSGHRDRRDVDGPGCPPRQLPLLEIPTNETVQFNLTSVDVIHSFWIVPFDFKRDVVPGFAEPLQGDADDKTGSFIRALL